MTDHFCGAVLPPSVMVLFITILPLSILSDFGSDVYPWSESSSQTIPPLHCDNCNNGRLFFAKNRAWSKVSTREPGSINIHAIIIKTAVNTVAFLIPAMIVKAMIPTMTALAMMTSPSNALACYQVDAPVSLEWMCGEILLLAKWYVVCLLIGLDKGRTNYWHVAKLCLPAFSRQIALYSPCRLSSVVTFCHH